MKILAFHNYASHDSGAAVLYDDGESLQYLTISEERLSRVKNSYFFPVRAMDYCMTHFGVNKLDEFDLVVSDYSYKQRLLNTNSRYRKLEADYIKTKLDVDYRKILYVDHHAAHAASAFYPSGFDEAAVLVVDGVGSECNTNSLYVGTRSGGLQLVDKAYGMGIGLVYTLITSRVLNFGTGEEGKTMGLAAIGEQYKEQRRILDFKPRYDGLVTDFSALVWRNPSAALRQNLPRCEDRTELTNSYFSGIAYELQDETERCMLHLSRYAYEKTGKKRLCIAGGVALNCVANERIVNESPFHEVFIQPASSDTGIPIGLGLWAYHERKKGKRCIQFGNAFTGRNYHSDKTEDLMRGFGVPYRRAEIKEVAKLLCEKGVVGWFIQNSELGPRALGHRSILADPRCAGIKDILNAKVKHREMFRPFAPSVLEERAGEYFIMKCKSPFMLLAPTVRPEKIEDIPAVVHVDKSARVHTVNARDNPKFYELISEFEKLTGIPVVVNTSFNDNGEPIVETPLDALICFLRTKMDYVFIDGFLITKTEIRDDIRVLTKLVEFREKTLKEQYQDAIRRLCPEYSAGELRAFLKEYYPMHRYYSKIHTMVRLQDILGSWEAGEIYTDEYHYEIIRRFLPEEHARQRERFVLVEDTYETLVTLKENSLVVLFNLSLHLKGRQLVNFYEDLSLPILRALLDEESWQNDLEFSNEYRSSNNWEAFYTKLLSDG
jgi:carbamoyltransferase